MTRANLSDLIQALEDIRVEKYTDVPKEIIQRIALSQYDNQDNRPKARNETMQIIGEYLNGITTEEK